MGWTSQFPSAPQPTPKHIRPEDLAETILSLAPTDDGPMRTLLHVLWTKAVGTPEYIKSDWQALEIVLHRMHRQLYVQPEKKRGG